MHRPRQKLTEQDVTYILANYDPGVVSYQMLADKFGVTRATIAAIITRRTWRGVADPREAGK